MNCEENERFGTIAMQRWEPSDSETKMATFHLLR